MGSHIGVSYAEVYIYYAGSILMYKTDLTYVIYSMFKPYKTDGQLDPASFHCNELSVKYPTCVAHASSVYMEWAGFMTCHQGMFRDTTASLFRTYEAPLVYACL